MQWDRLGRLAWLGLSLATVGCASGPALMAADPVLPRTIASAGSDTGTAATRAQKPDSATAKNPITLLSVAPEGVDPSAKAAVRIWALVNGEAILAEEVRAAAQQQLQYIRQLPEAEQRQKMDEIFKATLQTIIEREIVLQDAFARLKSKGAGKIIDKLKEAAGKEFDRTWLKGMMESSKVKSDEELKIVLAENGMSLDAARRNWERQFMAMEYLRSRIMPAVDRATGHVQLQEYYELHPEEFKVADSVEWQDLFIAAGRHPDRASARKLAESIVANLKKGEPFKKLSEQHDDGDSRLRNGAGIGRKHGEIKPPEVEAILFQMKDGEIGPIVEMANGFHVIRLEKRTLAGQLPFDLKAQKEIKDKIRGEVGNREMKKIVNELKRSAVIEYAR